MLKRPSLPTLVSPSPPTIKLKAKEQLGGRESDSASAAALAGGFHDSRSRGKDSSNKEAGEDDAGGRGESDTDVEEEGGDEHASEFKAVGVAGGSHKSGGASEEDYVRVTIGGGQLGVRG